jgi:hypothetical protein
MEAERAGCEKIRERTLGTVWVIIYQRPTRLVKNGARWLGKEQRPRPPEDARAVWPAVRRYVRAEAPGALRSLRLLPAQAPDTPIFSFPPPPPPDALGQSINSSPDTFLPQISFGLIWNVDP